MRNALFAVFFTTSWISAAYCQTWAPIGAKWTYGTMSVFQGTIHFSTWEAVSDTSLNNYTYSRIERMGNAVDGDYKDHFFTREDDNIVWIYSDSLSSFTKLFDFGRDTGEWWTTDIGYCPLTMTVIDTRTDTIKGIPYKSMKIQYEGPDTSKGSGTMWVNRLVGGLERPLPFYDFYCNNAIPDNETYTGLRCYEDTAIGLWQKDTTLACQYSTVGIDQSTDALELKVYPNPFTDEVFVEMPSSDQRVTIHLYDAQGKEVHRYGSSTYNGLLRVSIDGPGGMYLLQVSYAGKDEGIFRKSYRLIKQ